jgi:hypothetical protein
VRPDALRVETTVTAATNVFATAYKTDTSMMVIAINNNNVGKEIIFTINNADYTEFTQFTTSETKSMVNMGSITTNSGTFSLTLEPYSISTFTTSAKAGGRYNNVPPLAVAGDDIILDDLDGTGSTVISLNASASSDSDGEILNYSWSLNGQQISWESSHELTISVGEYDIVLTVTDNDGATDTDTLNAVLNSTSHTEIWLEAECGTVGTNWQTLTDNNASNGKYVLTTAGIQNLDNASLNPDDHLVYSFTCDETGTYKIWGHVITPTPNDDSFWVKVDELDWVMWNSIAAGSEWHWDDVHNQSNDNVVFYTLEPGEHVLSICMREDGAKLDKIAIINTGIVPTGLGGGANNCPPDTTSINLPKNGASDFEVYPNPSSGIINISWIKGFNTFTVINQQGKTVIYKSYPNAIHSINEVIDLKPGIYLIMLRNDNIMAVRKIIIDK